MQLLAKTLLSMHSERLEQSPTIKYTVKDQSYIKSWQNHKNIFLPQQIQPTHLQWNNVVPVLTTIVLPWALEVFESWGSIDWPGPWRARGARAYNGGLGTEPPAGSRGRAPGGGSGWRSPPEAESFLVLERPTKRQNLSRCQLVVFIGTWYRFIPKI